MVACQKMYYTETAADKIVIDGRYNFGPKIGVCRDSQLVIITRHLAINMRTFAQHNALTRTLPCQNKRGP